MTQDNWKLHDTLNRYDLGIRAGINLLDEAGIISNLAVNLSAISDVDCPKAIAWLHQSFGKSQQKETKWKKT